jgi:hypothetical protein
MAKVGRVKTSAEKGNAAATGEGAAGIAAGLLVHVSIVICDGCIGRASNK